MHMLRTCEKLDEGVGLAELYGGVRLVKVGKAVRLSIPNIMHMPFYFKTRCIK